MSEPKILIAVPMLSEVKAEFLVSLMGLQTTKNTEMSVKINTLVYSARNHLAYKALDEKFDYILWLDSDMTFKPDTLLKLLADAETGKDYVSGLCFMRSIPTLPVISKKITWERNEETRIITHGSETYKDYPQNQVFEIAGSGLACCLMKTQLIAEIAESFGVSPFQPMPMLSEDYSFCWRMGKLGKKMWCDSSVKCGHIGSYCFTEETYLHGLQLMEQEEQQE